MCGMSSIHDYWNNKFPNSYPNTFNNIAHSLAIDTLQNEVAVLRKDIEQLKILLAAAKKYDESTGQAECESEEKMKLLKTVAEALGIDLSDAIK